MNIVASACPAFLHALLVIGSLQEYGQLDILISNAAVSLQLQYDHTGVGHAGVGHQTAKPATATMGDCSTGKSAEIAIQANLLTCPCHSHMWRCSSCTTGH